MSDHRPLEALIASFDGRVGLYALDLQTNQSWAYQAETIFPTASIIKLAVLAALMQQVEAGDYQLDDPLMLRRADSVGGSGILRYLSPGLQMSIRDWAFLMMHVSDNLATNVLIDHVGLAYIQEWLLAHGYPDVQLHRKIDFAQLDKDKTQLGTATAVGMNRLMTAVFRHEILTPAACNEMLRMMNKVGADRVGRYLPFEPYDDPTPEAERLQLAGKTGSLAGCRGQTAVVWQQKEGQSRGFSLTVLTDGNSAPETWGPDAPGVLLIGRLARAIYDQIFTA